MPSLTAPPVCLVSPHNYLRCSSWLVAPFSHQELSPASHFLAVLALSPGRDLLPFSCLILPTQHWLVFKLFSHLFSLGNSVHMWTGLANRVASGASESWWLHSALGDLSNLVTQMRKGGLSLSIPALPGHKAAESSREIKRRLPFFTGQEGSHCPGMSIPLALHMASAPASTRGF